MRANFLLVLEKLVAQGAYVGIATHDEYLIGEALRHRRATCRATAYEFQMLLGVRPERADELVAAGHRVRIYVPYGTQWYEYSLRRLQENPKIAGYIAGDTVGRIFGRSSWPHGLCSGGRWQPPSSMLPKRAIRGLCPTARPPPRSGEQGEAAVDDQRLAAHHRRVGPSRGTRLRRRCRPARRSGRPGSRGRRRASPRGSGSAPARPSRRRRPRRR